MDEITLVQVDCKTEPENNSDEVNTMLELPLLEEREEEMTVKQENFEVDDLAFKTEPTKDKSPGIQIRIHNPGFRSLDEETAGISIPSWGRPLEPTQQCLLKGNASKYFTLIVAGSLHGNH